ncbi:hypothetical protein GZL_01850 [Streptomyces sp. 769]|nr:hypothetical protein GZL_01850 [Streptomyces sp. 769]
MILVLHGAHSVTLGSEKGSTARHEALAPPPVHCRCDRPTIQSPVPPLGCLSLAGRVR